MVGRAPADARSYSMTPVDHLCALLRGAVAGNAHDQAHAAVFALTTVLRLPFATLTASGIEAERNPVKLIDLTQPADDPNNVLLSATAESLTNVVIVGDGPDGFYVASSYRTGVHVVHALSQATYFLHTLQNALEMSGK